LTPAEVSQLTYDPNGDFTGNDTFTFTVTDNNGAESPAATITIQVIGAPVVSDDIDSYVPGQAKVVSVLENDGTILPESIIILDADEGTNGLQKTVPNEGVWTVDIINGTITFTPENGFNGNPTPISYTGEDVNGVVSNPATITITAILPPIATADFDLDNLPNSIVVVNILSNDTLSSGLPVAIGSVSIDLDPDLGGIQDTYLSVGEGVFSFNETSGLLTFTPVSGFFDNPTPIFYTLTDTLTGLSDTAMVNITYLFEPELELIKQGVLSGNGSVGDIVTFNFTIINTGNVPIFNVSITDAMLSSNPISVSPRNISPGGSAIASVEYSLTEEDIARGFVSNSAIANGLSPQGVDVSDISDNGDPTQSGSDNPTVILLPSQPVVDLKLTKTVVGDCQRQIGDIVTFNVIVSRVDTSSTLVSVIVKDSLGQNWEYVNSSASIGTYNPLTQEWTGVSISNSDTATLTIQARILTNMGGLMCNEAWIEYSSIPDMNSTAGNKDPNEDDFGRACVSVPMTLCSERGETIELNSETGHTSYQWYRNGILIDGAISSSYTATVGGTYSVVIDGGGCSNGSCCPIYIQDFCECPSNICVPIRIRKTR
jgi:large repetitive protein